MTVLRKYVSQRLETCFWNSSALERKSVEFRQAVKEVLAEGTEVRALKDAVTFETNDLTSNKDIVNVLRKEY